MTTLAPFDLTLPGKVLFGRGRGAEAPAAIAGFGRRVVLVHGRDAARTAWLGAALAERGCKVTAIACPREPDLDLLTDARAQARIAAPEVVVGIGGGAVLDLAKALAALVPAPGDPMDHLEVVGRGAPLVADPLPLVVLPSTAGTGSEATRNAVIGVPEHARKVSLRDARMLPRVVVIDPALTDGMSAAQTLASGLDAITQLIEPYLCSRANPFTDALCAAALPPALAALRQLLAREDAGARDALAYAAHVSGIALANAGLGAVHGLAGVIGGRAPGAPHGAVCGRLLAPVLAANRAALAADAPQQARFGQVEAWISDAFGPGGSRRLAEWAREAGLPGLVQLGVARQDFPAIAEAAAASSSMKANPVRLEAAALVEILQDAA